jgi:cytochrome c2
MSYAGISDPQDRADMVVYLRSLAEEPEPLPEPEAAEAGGEAASGDGGDAAAAADGGGAAASDGGDAQATAAEDAAANGEPSATDAGSNGGGSATAAADGAGQDAEQDTGGDTQTAAADTAAGAEAAGTGGGDTAGSGDNPLVQRVASASVSEGESAFRACSACHTVDQGGANRVGPNLWNVVGQDIAGKEDYTMYSDALAGKEGAWTLAKLDAWLENPMAWAEGTSMSYAGLQDPEQRAAVIAYLRSLSENPPPLEEVAGEATAQGG